MTQKQKEIELLVPLITGKKVKIWTSAGGADGFFCEGTVDGFTGSHLVLKWVTVWNGIWHDEKMIHSGVIGKIEVDNETKHF